MPNNLKSIFKTSLFTSSALILILMSYCYFNGITEYKIAKDALRLNDRNRAVTHFSRAINWYLPFASYIDDSVKGIMDIAGHHEESGRYDDAKYAYNVLRGALNSVISTYAPKREYIKICNERIASLNAKSVVLKSGDGDFAKEMDEQFTILTRSGKTDLKWSSLASLSFLSWVFLTVLLISRLFKKNVVNINIGVILIAIIDVMLYIVWLVSLTKA